MFRPRSIVRLILIGFAVVLVPLIAAVITAVVQVDRLAEASHEAVLEAELATQQSRSLVEQLTEMQRALGQFEVLGDQAFYDVYLNRRAAFHNAVGNLSALGLTDPGREQLERLVAEEQQLFDSLPHEQGLPGGNSAAWSALASRARAVLSESSRLIETQAAYVTGSADQLQRTLLSQAAAVIPVTIALAGMFLVLITRPMGQLGEAIRRLGARDFSSAVEVRGPQDVEELGRQLDWLRRRIHELEQQKLNFLRHISHELKTPLTTIREGAELLTESLAHSAPEDAEISRIMRSNSLHLQQLIEDLLQFGKSQDTPGALELSDEVDLAEVVRAVAEAKGLQVGAKGIDLAQSLAAVRARCDRNKVRIVVDNLLANAIKYTPAGGAVTVSLAAQDGMAVLDISDTGPGIDAGEQDSVFEPFYQGQAEYQSHVKGTGLGLAIAREYVEAHDGYIEVLDSSEGAHFRVGLPVGGPSA